MKTKRPKTIRLGTSRLSIQELFEHTQVLMYNDNADASQVCFCPGWLVALSVDPLSDGAALSTLTEDHAGRYHATVIFTSGDKLFQHHRTVEELDVGTNEEVTLKYVVDGNYVTIDSWTQHKTLETLTDFIPEQ